MNPDHTADETLVSGVLNEAVSWTRVTAGFEESMLSISETLVAPVDVQIAALDRYVEHLNETLRPAQEAAVAAQERILEAFAPTFDALRTISESVTARLETQRAGPERQLRRARFEIALHRRRRVRAHLIRLRCHLRHLPDTVPVEVVEALAAVVADIAALCAVSARPSPALSPRTVHVQRRRPLTRNLCPHAPPVALRPDLETSPARYSTTRPPGN